MRRNISLVATAAIAFTITGCSGDKPETTSDAPAAAAPSAAADAADASGPLALGSATTIAETSLAITAHAFKAAQAGAGAVDVETCNKSQEPASVSSAPWSLVLVDGTTVSSLGVVSGAKAVAPEYKEQTVQPGACQRGWITFEVPDPKQAKAVSYGPEPEPGKFLQPVTWTVA
ncbi:DUF4352 domain-containing protein [Pilimelia columellifera]|uniref:DUF4352 domain-containing protein n=1 Tax=Pilimelia columellifera subsp. columellifera TaxID=706583 RepID=A0ABP6A6R7_9ACTN